MKTRLTTLLIALAVSVSATGTALAQVNLRFTPADTTVGPGGTGRLAIMIDDLDANVRTVDVYVTYDTTVVASVTGNAGAAFLDSGYFLFKGFENDIPGQWHGYCVILGSTDWLTGPGELYTWDFEGLTNGASPIVAVEAYVAAGDGTYYPDVVLDPTSITVFDPASAVDDTPTLRTGLRAWPNPFNPTTNLQVDLPQPGDAHVAVYDLRGRQVVVLHHGPTTAGRHVYPWHGRDTGGMIQPTGQYFVRLVTGQGTATTKVTLVK